MRYGVLKNIEASGRIPTNETHWNGSVAVAFARGEGKEPAT